MQCVKQTGLKQPGLLGSTRGLLGHKGLPFLKHGSSSIGCLICRFAILVVGCKDNKTFVCLCLNVFVNK